MHVSMSEIIGNLEWLKILTRQSGKNTFISIRKTMIGALCISMLHILLRSPCLLMRTLCGSFGSELCINGIA